MIDPQTVLDAVAAQAGAISKVSRFVHEHPELGHEEHECSRYLCDTLASAGLEVERGVAGMETAFRATLAGARPGPDDRLRLPLRRGGGRAARRAHRGRPFVRARADRRWRAPARRWRSASSAASLAGSVVVIGCPADEIHAPGTIERGGGKAISAEAGLWDGVDAALYAHPEFIDTVSLESRWMRRATATVAGTRSLGTPTSRPCRRHSAALEMARSLLPDDVMLERLELEGDVEEDTGLVLKATFLVFGDEEAGVERGLAIVQDALPDATWSVGRLVEAVRPDDRVTAAVAAAFRALGRDFVENPPRLPFATDFGNISRRCPAALIGVGRDRAVGRSTRTRVRRSSRRRTATRLR